MLQYPNKMTFDIMEGGGVPPPPVGMLQIRVSTEMHLRHSDFSCLLRKFYAGQLVSKKSKRAAGFKSGPHHRRGRLSE